TDESCSNQNNGAIDLTVTGGQSPYTYTWSDAGNSTTQDLTSLGAGSYSVTVTDDNNCTVSTTAQVNVSTVISNQANVTDPTCAGNNNAQINNTTLGGASPYTDAWSNGLTGNQNKGLLPGNYYITITDNNNCQIIDTVTVSSPSMACAGSN